MCTLNLFESFDAKTVLPLLSIASNRLTLVMAVDSLLFDETRSPRFSRQECENRDVEPGRSDSHHHGSPDRQDDGLLRRVLFLR